MTHKPWLLVIAIAGCTSPSSLPHPTMSEPLVVHEWGTFTSMLGSDGVSLEGLHHEEERLPAFVHARAPGDALANKGLELQPTGVTQKLETPVLYFYGAAQAVRVHVDFPKGVLSQWYPDAMAFQPALGMFTEPAGGAMDWQAQLKPGMSGFPSVSADDIWAPSRRVASVPIEIGAEREQFIFYRGVGGFGVPFRAGAGSDGTLAIENASGEPIAAVFLLRVDGTNGTIVELGPLAAGQRRAGISPPAA